jgi:two-component system chemotaxis response regulator CheB
MPKIRILVVDDSVVVRRMVSDVLASDPQLEIAGAAANGKIALAKIPQVNPDIVILDAGGDPQVATEATGYHVQYAHRAGR